MTVVEAKRIMTAVQAVSASDDFVRSVAQYEAGKGADQRRQQIRIKECPSQESAGALPRPSPL
eukprot:2882126-Pleurochrysis_carterae.AAC.6